MIQLENISKIYEKNNERLLALNQINCTINSGEFIGITGLSGSGKSTLLNILGCLDRPSSGNLIIDGQSVTSFNENELSQIRCNKIGFVFQSFNLISSYTAIRNVELPMLYAGIDAEIRHKRASLALNAVGLSDRYHHFPAELSGGQQQRVAIARAVVNNPPIIVADEPTGSLDENTSVEIMKLFSQLHASGRTIIFVTHDKGLLSLVDRVLHIDNGQLVGAG